MAGRPSLLFVKEALLLRVMKAGKDSYAFQVCNTHTAFSNTIQCVQTHTIRDISGIPPPISLCVV